jgi:hypothetical protein
MAILPDLLLLAIDGDDVLGIVMAGYDGHRSWLYSVVIRRSHRQSGVGAALVHGAEEALKSLWGTVPDHVGWKPMTLE